MANDMTLTGDELQIIAHSQTNMGTVYDAQFLVRTVAQGISAPAGVKATPADVLTVLKKAAAMHLDPLAGAVYAFKTKQGNLVVGVSKQGWQQALASQKDFAGLYFKHGNEVNKTVHVSGRGSSYDVRLSGYEWSTCVIKKRMVDGTIGEFSGTAYLEEEFDPSKPTWAQRPRRMLDSRALTIAASNAYGWGAYSPEEVEEVSRITPMVSQGLMQAQECHAPTPTSGGERVSQMLNGKKEAQPQAQIMKDDLETVEDL